MQLYSDTSPEVEQLIIERLWQMPVWRKLALVSELNQTVRTLALAGLRQRHPNDTPAQLRRRLAGLLLGEELAFKAYGPLPDSNDAG